MQIEHYEQTRVAFTKEINNSIIVTLRGGGLRSVIHTTTMAFITPFTILTPFGYVKPQLSTHLYLIQA